MPGSRISQRGAALITVLMIVAAMSAIALGITQSVTRATERARALDGQAQLRFYAASVEEAAKARLYELLSPTEGRLSKDMPGYGEPQTIPIEGGVFVVTVRDGANCFDLNTLVSGVEGRSLAVDTDKVERFENLFAAPEYESYNIGALASALVDWMDTDSIARSGGAEDAYYLGLRPSYRTSGQYISSLQELRGIRGFDADIIAALSALVCARPARLQSTPTRLNLNTLEPHHAPLLRQVLPDSITIEDALSLIENRPIGGWLDLAFFYQEPPLNKIDPSLLQTDRLGLQTSLVEVDADVSYRGQVMSLRFLFQAQPGEPVRTLHRQRVG